MAKTKRRADGRVVITKIYDKKRKFFYGKTKYEANVKLEEYEKNLEEEYIFNNSMTYNAWLDLWLESKTDTISKNTMQSYKSLFSKHIRPELGNYRLCTINTPLLKTFINSLKKSGLSSRSLIYIITLLKSSLRQAVIDDFLLKNPADKIIKPKLIPTKKVIALNKAETVKLLSVIKEPKYYNLFSLALRTGLRRSEILGLRWTDIDFDNNTLSVEQTVLKINNVAVISPSVKNKSSHRTITIDDKAIQLLKHQMKLVLANKLKSSHDYYDHDLIFPNENGLPSKPDTISKKARYFQKLAELPKEFTFHTLRHTHATLLLKAGINFKVIQARLGHSSYQITMDTYSHVVPDNDKDLLDKITSVF